MKTKYSFSKWRFWSYLSSYENFKKNGEMIEKMKKDYDQRFMLYHKIIEAHTGCLKIDFLPTFKSGFAAISA